MYNFNNYEIMRDIPDNAINNEIEYIYITDNDKLIAKNWKIIVDPDLDGLSPFDKCYAVRFNLFKYTDANIVMYVDGSVQILNDIINYFKKFECSDKDVGIMVHPERCTMFDEYKKWVEIRNYPVNCAYKCLSYMETHNYDIHNYKGLYQGCLRFVKNTVKNTLLDTTCLALLKELGDNNIIERLDQTIYSYLLNTKFKDMTCFTFSDSCIYSNIMNIQNHGCAFHYNRHVIRPYSKTGYFRNNLINLVDL